MPIERQSLNPPMDCTEIERSIDAYLDAEFDGREEAEADAHVAACGRCQALVAREAHRHAALRSALRAALGPESPAGRAPPALRARVVEALAREKRPLWRRVLSPVPMAAVAACAAGAMVVLVGHGGDDGLLDEAVRNHNRGLPLEINAASVGPEAIPGWFAGKLDFRAAPPRFEDAEVRVVGARLSHLREWPAAYYRYELPRGQAGLFIVDDPNGRFAAAGREIQVGPRRIRVAAARGYNVAMWRQDEIVYSLVSDLDEQALLQLVRTAQADVRR
ncbi:MAG TPA: zf-HC2 domain-containing protein [Anaeromyxobacteraceae bacterium]|nr:zf-HC2 domain-containing protein [Anaeromyxobacteraceae bacterium]